MITIGNVSITSNPPRCYCSVCSVKTATMYELRLERVGGAIVLYLCVRCKCNLHDVMEEESIAYDGY